jgi:hypothetical protein
MIGSIALLNVQVQGLGRMLEKEGGEAVRLELERMLLQDKAHLNCNLPEQGMLSCSPALEESLAAEIGLRVDLDLHTIAQGYVLDFWVGTVLMASYNTMGVASEEVFHL